MRYLITGGAGFLGSYFCQELLRRGAAGVVALDDLSTGRVENLRAVRDHPRFRFEEGSVLERARVAALVEEADAVFHLAAVVGVRRVLADPERTLEVNVRGSDLVLGESVRQGRLALFSSSSEVYGPRAAVPQREGLEPAELPGTARWAYARSKRLGERSARVGARKLARAGRGAVFIVRLFNTVGARQSAEQGMVLPSFARRAVRDEPIVVFGSGHQARAFVHARDVVRSCLALAEEPRASGIPVNVGGTSEVEIGALAALVRRCAGSGSPIVRLAYRRALGVHFEDPPRRLPDTGLLRRLTGFRPSIGLLDAVQEVVAEHRRRENVAVSPPQGPAAVVSGAAGGAGLAAP